MSRPSRALGDMCAECDAAFQPVLDWMSWAGVAGFLLAAGLGAPSEAMQGESSAIVALYAVGVAAMGASIVVWLGNGVAWLVSRGARAVRRTVESGPT